MIRLKKFEPMCNITCDCDFDKFSPICGSDGMTYFSSCHAGCSSASKVNGQMEFSDCLCIPSDLGEAIFNSTPYHNWIQNI